MVPAVGVPLGNWSHSLVPLQPLHQPAPPPHVRAPPQYADHPPLPLCGHLLQAVRLPASDYNSPITCHLASTLVLINPASLAVDG